MGRPRKDAAKTGVPEESNSTGLDRPRGFSTVYEDLREDILSLKFAPNEPLDEVNLAERFGVSRTPIREALLMLASDGLVTMVRGRGASVAPHTMSNAHEYLDTLMLLSRAVSRLAATARTAEDLSVMSAAKSRYEESLQTGDVLAIAYADLEFHRSISLSCGNEFLGRYHRNALDAGRRTYLLHYYPMFGDADRALCVASHDQLVAAIQGGDADKAEQVASDHVMSEVRAIQRSLEPKMGSQFALNTGIGNR